MKPRLQILGKGADPNPGRYPSLGEHAGNSLVCVPGELRMRSPGVAQMPKRFAGVPSNIRTLHSLTVPGIAGTLSPTLVPASGG